MTRLATLWNETWNEAQGFQRPRPLPDPTLLAPCGIRPFSPPPLSQVVLDSSACAGKVDSAAPPLQRAIFLGGLVLPLDSRQFSLAIVAHANVIQATNPGT